MKPNQNLSVWAIAGLCGTALSLPQVPYYASRFPQHPQNLGYQGDYPKYWQGEAYKPVDTAASYNYPTPPEAVPAAVEAEEKKQRPSFTGSRYPAREAIKYYSGNSFPVHDDSASEVVGEDSPNKSVQNIKITNDTPGDNDKSYTRVTKGPGIGLRKKKALPVKSIEEDRKEDVAEPVRKSGGIEDIADVAIPEFNGSKEVEEGEEDENWNSFTFGVVSDSLVYHDPYENREGEFERKTNALEKIEKMMGQGFGASKEDDVEEHSLERRDWPEHIQEKALKMMDNASSMQAKGQKTIENDPQYQESLKSKSHDAATTPDAARKSTFPVSPKSKEGSNKQPVPAPNPTPQAGQIPPQEKTIGYGGGGLLPQNKAEKLGRTKIQSPQRQPATPPGQNQPPQKNQPSTQRNTPPNVNRRVGNSEPQQGNTPVQGKSSSGLNAPNQRNLQTPQKVQRRPQQARPQQQRPQQQRPQQQRPNLMKRQVAVPAGPGYPPGAMITRITRPTVGQVNDGQTKQISDGQIQGVPIQAPAHAPAPIVIPQVVPIPTPVAHAPAPIFHPPATVVHVPASAGHAPAHVIHVPAPAGHAPAHVFHVPAPAVHAPGTVVHAPAPIFHTPAHVVHAPATIVHAPVPTVHVPAPIVHAPRPVVHTPIVHAPPPIVHAPPPTVHVPPPTVHRPAPAVHVPAPAPVPAVKEQLQFAAIVHPGEVICPGGKTCAPPAPKFEEKTYFQPVQKVREVEVTHEVTHAIPKFEPVEVTRYVDVEKEMQVEKQVMVKPTCETCLYGVEEPACETCMREIKVQKPVCESCMHEKQVHKPVTICSVCKKTVDECTCGGERGGYGPVSTPGGLEAFFREKMPEHFQR